MNCSEILANAKEIENSHRSDDDIWLDIVSNILNFQTSIDVKVKMICEAVCDQIDLIERILAYGFSKNLFGKEIIDEITEKLR